MNYSEAQLEIINTIDGNIGVIASAGSGKTTVLTKRIENMVKNHSIAPQDILAVTFSKKAKENIQDKLKELNVNGVNIETFHSLALKIIGTRYLITLLRQEDLLTNIRIQSENIDILAIILMQHIINYPTQN